MKTVLIHERHSKYAQLWSQALTRRGHTVSPVTGSVLDTEQLLPSDIVVPLVLVKDYFERRSGRYEAALSLQRAGIPLLNNCQSIEASSDKLKTYRVWRTARIRQPRTWPLAGLRKWPRGKVLILKPAFSHSGNDVHLVRSLAEAKRISRIWKSPALIQVLIENAVCIRVIATPNECLSAIEKVVPTDELIASIKKGATPRHIKIDTKLDTLARRMVAALKGSLMGVDILRKADGEYFALEANVPFGFDPDNSNLHKKMVSIAEKMAHQSRHPGSPNR